MFKKINYLIIFSAGLLLPAAVMACSVGATRVQVECHTGQEAVILELENYDDQIAQNDFLKLVESSCDEDISDLKKNFVAEVKKWEQDFVYFVDGYLTFKRQTPQFIQELDEQNKDYRNCLVSDYSVHGEWVAIGDYHLKNYCYLSGGGGQCPERKISDGKFFMSYITNIDSNNLPLLIEIILKYLVLMSLVVAYIIHIFFRIKKSWKFVFRTILYLLLAIIIAYILIYFIIDQLVSDYVYLKYGYLGEIGKVWIWSLIIVVYFIFIALADYFRRLRKKRKKIQNNT